MDPLHCLLVFLGLRGAPQSAKSHVVCQAPHSQIMLQGRKFQAHLPAQCGRGGASRARGRRPRGARRCRARPPGAQHGVRPLASRAPTPTQQRERPACPVRTCGCSNRPLRLSTHQAGDNTSWRLLRRPRAHSAVARCAKPCAMQGRGTPPSAPLDTLGIPKSAGAPADCSPYSYAQHRNVKTVPWDTLAQSARQSPAGMHFADKAGLRTHAAAAARAAS